MGTTASIIICFYPDATKLRKLIASIDAYVDHIILFDNGGLDLSTIHLISGKIIVETRDGVNLGIARPLNIGCELALALGCRYLVTFDQDSSPSKDMIPTLIKEIEGFSSEGRGVAAIGPQLIDMRDGRPHASPFIRFTKFGYRKWTGQGTEPVSHLITSGCLIDLKLWKTLSKFDERLFIDLVDNNWCWNLIRQGAIVLGTTRAVMVHELSLQIKRYPGMSLNGYSPIRRYYQCRNAFYHLVYEPLSVGQRLYVAKGLLVALISSLFADRQAAQSFIQCLHGLMHGAVKRLGAYKS